MTSASGGTTQPSASRATIPRWEKRAFGASFPLVEAWLETYRAPVRHSHETYIVSPADDVNVKIRDGRLDVKRRITVERGLERWSPVLATPFPIDWAVVRDLYALWRLAPPVSGDAPCTLDALLADVRARSALSVWDVMKSRRQVATAGCAGELAALVVAGQFLRTAAVESDDPDEVIRLACALGLDGLENVSYVAALRRLLHVDATPRARAWEGASS